MIELTDEKVGTGGGMLPALSRTCQRKNTVAIFMSDHGEMLGDHDLIAKGCRSYEAAMRVPLVISWIARYRQEPAADAGPCFRS